MAWPKFFNEILDRLERIEAKIDGLWQEPEPQMEMPAPLSMEPNDVARRWDYSELSAAEIIEMAGEWTAEERMALADYESAHSNRVTVLRALRSE